MNPKIEIEAWIVPVWTTNDPPMAFCWIAGCSDPAEAQDAIRRKIGTGSEIGSPSPVAMAQPTSWGSSREMRGCYDRLARLAGAAGV